MLTAKNSARYRVDRLTTLPGGRMENATMEIDLEAQPPQLRRVVGAGQPKYLSSQALGEPVPMNEALRFVARLSQEVRTDTSALSLRGYGLYLGQENPPLDRIVPREYGETDKTPFLLAVSRLGDPAGCALHFLPPR